VDTAFGYKTRQKTPVYTIIKKVKAGETTVDLRCLNTKKTMQTAVLITSVATTVEEDWRMMIELLAAAQMPIGCVHSSFTRFSMKFWA
jgi:hypothetical protein